MPFKYAIRVKTDKVISRNYYDEPTYAYEFQLVPKDFADTHKKGMKKLVSVTGEDLSGWVPINRMAFDLTAIKRNSQFPALPDFMGTQLAVGDYVVTYVKRYEDLQVCEVIGFVKQGKIRMIPVDDFEQSHGLLRFPREIVKIPSSVLGDEPNSEWIPSEEDMF